jgi:hypothetical protein
LSEFWISAGIEFGAAFFGILLGFEINRRWERRKYEKRLEEILPTIFLEIKDNRELLKELYNTERGFIQTIKRFDTSNWDIHSEDISRIEQTLLMNLTKIHYNLKQLNNLLDKCRLDRYPSEPINSSIRRIADKTRPLVDSTLERLEKLLKNKYQKGYERIKQQRQKLASLL